MGPMVISRAVHEKLQIYENHYFVLFDNASKIFSTIQHV
jgi:hypothetical protein